MSTFEKPLAVQDETGRWQVTYRMLRRLAQAGQAGSIGITESRTVAFRVTVRRGHDLRLAGHTVSFLTLSGGRNQYAMRWKTPSAVYFVLAAGAPESIVKRIVACLP
jgi:hypothetical protein